MEIERKFLIKKLPDNLDTYPYKEIEQGYLNTSPVVRIRKSDENYELTYKSKGHMVREEYNLPLNKESYYHLKEKVDGRIISKTRYLIPLEYTPTKNTLTIELDIFKDDLSPLMIAEVEFETENDAKEFIAPSWFGKDVTFDGKFHNSYLSNSSISL
ncbi:MAG: CYTH domain-containing protein [Suipraeoptans sp.]